MSRKLGHAKSAHSDVDPVMTQVWHGLVDTLRLLPTVPAKVADPTSSEASTVDDALEKVSTLIALRKGEHVPPDRLPFANPTINVAIPSTPSSSTGGTKRKRRPSVSVSPAPPPLPSATSFDSNLSSIASPRPPTASLAAGLGLGPGSAKDRSAKDRSATPMSAREAVSASASASASAGKARRDQYADQLPLQPGRRVAFKVPHDSKGVAAGSGSGGGASAAEVEDEEWILATVKRCILNDKTRYEVIDADDLSKDFKTTIKSILPLPEPNVPSHPSQQEDFPKHSIVLGLYPDTTSFYQATVIAAPVPGTGMAPAPPKGAGVRADPGAKRGKYLLAFVDDDDRVHEVDVHDVVVVSPRW